ncbi:hypothetical protein JYP52_21150 [Nitratireductor aquibiodomus]|nr:hypothetical protein [Nitratireductor aquibiodomus]MBN7763651.1 hypothetical protein [Nitratireductor aquibiodomus]
MTKTEQKQARKPETDKRNEPLPQVDFTSGEQMVAYLERYGEIEVFNP